MPRTSLSLKRTSDVFQRIVVEKILRGLAGVCVQDERAHDARLKAVLDRIDDNQMTPDIRGCQIKQPELICRDHVVSQRLEWNNR
jgi:hypothetical protein